MMIVAGLGQQSCEGPGDNCLSEGRWAKSQGIVLKAMQNEDIRGLSVYKTENPDE